MARTEMEFQRVCKHAAALNKRLQHVEQLLSQFRAVIKVIFWFCDGPFTFTKEALRKADEEVDMDGVLFITTPTGELGIAPGKREEGSLIIAPGNGKQETPGL